MAEQHMLYVGTHGPEDPTRATLVFAAAIRMTTKKVPVKVALLGEGIRLLQDDIAKTTRVTGARAPYTSIHDMMDAARKAGVEIHC